MTETVLYVLTANRDRETETLLVLDGSGRNYNGREGVHECKFFDVRWMPEKPEFAQAVPFSERSWRSYL